MLGLSITAIGLRPLEECKRIFQTLQKPMQLEFLELAIGSPCHVDFDYPPVPLILHDSCLYENRIRQKLDPFRPQTWNIYTKFIASHDVRAVSLHAPLKRESTQLQLETALSKLQTTLQVPVYVEVMPSSEYWCSSRESLVDFPLLLDVSHILIWHQGDRKKTQQTCLSLIDSQQVGAIHLSENQGKADTHDLIPEHIWFQNAIASWKSKYLVTFESLPAKYSAYERLDKQRFRLPF
ncbi:MAG: hypothetical protein ACRDBG_11890 [Waterburya sp.]